MSCRTCCRNVSLVLALLALAVLATPAFAGNCIGDVSRANSCSAGDVRIAAVDSTTVNVFQGGIPHTNQCIEHGTFSFTADFEVKTTSNSARSNIGIFFGTGQASAFSGTCTDRILSPRYPCAYIPDPNHPGQFISTSTCGDDNYYEADGSINGETAGGCTTSGGVTTCTAAGCGDTSSTDNFTNAFGPGTQRATLEVDNVTCPAAGSTCPAASGLTGSCLVLPVCSSWYQPANGMPSCESPGGTTSNSAPASLYPWVAAAIPGTPSKCTCGVLYVPVIPVTVTPTVAKSCTTTLSTGLNTSCDAGPEGSTVTYTVAITSTATLANNNTVVDQICDTAYGTIYDDNLLKADGVTRVFAVCAAGTVGSSTGTNCPPDGTTGIAPGATASCTFTATQGEIAIVKDIVSASGHSSLDTSSTFTNTQSHQVTVTSSDAPTTAKTGLAYAGPQAACVTERYTVTVQNTGAADESVTLNSTTTGGIITLALNDGRYADLSSTHGSASADASVVGTTCGVASGSPGLGTMGSLQPGAVTASYIPADCVGGGANFTLANCNGGAYPATLVAGTAPTPPPTTNGGIYQCQFDGVICGAATAVGTCSAGLQKTDTTGVNANLTLDNGETVGVGNTFTETSSPFTTTICLVQQ